MAQDASQPRISWTSSAAGVSRCNRHYRADAVRLRPTGRDSSLGFCLASGRLYVGRCESGWVDSSLVFLPPGTTRLHLLGETLRTSNRSASCINTGPYIESIAKILCVTALINNENPLSVDPTNRFHGKP